MRSQKRRAGHIISLTLATAVGLVLHTRVADGGEVLELTCDLEDFLCFQILEQAKEAGFYFDLNVTVIHSSEEAFRRIISASIAGSPSDIWITGNPRAQERAYKEGVLADPPQPVMFGRDVGAYVTVVEGSHARGPAEEFID